MYTGRNGVSRRSGMIPKTLKNEDGKGDFASGTSHPHKSQIVLQQMYAVEIVLDRSTHKPSSTQGI